MSNKSIIPLSVPSHLLKKDPQLWNVPVNGIEWEKVTKDKIIIVAGCSFVNPSDPYGLLGNPFVVVAGDKVKDLSASERLVIAQKANTPETVFINSFDNGILNLTVYTPSGNEMGACAHGFIGTLQTLLNLGQLQLGTNITIHTTINTSANASVSFDGNIALEFEAQSPKKLAISNERLSKIYGIRLDEAKNLGVLSVGSPKLTIELSPSAFTQLQKNLKNMSYDELLTLQKEADINGIHVFCRNPQTHLPEKCIQNNAYSGRENLTDRATGVSNAAQISDDKNVKVGQRVTVTQYVANGPSAILNILKKDSNKVEVGGNAVLFNYRKEIINTK